jgi:hypothetical protein
MPPWSARLANVYRDLQQLVLMAQQDKHLTRIAPDFTWLDTDASRPRANVGLSTEHWNRGRDLFRCIGLPVGTAEDEDAIFSRILRENYPGGLKGCVYS